MVNVVTSPDALGVDVPWKSLAVPFLQRLTMKGTGASFGLFR